MNVFWIDDGEKITVLGVILIVLSIFVIFTTQNTLWAAFAGFLIFPTSMMTFKGAHGWSWQRAAQKL